MHSEDSVQYNQVSLRILKWEAEDLSFLNMCWSDERMPRLTESLLGADLFSLASSSSEPFFDFLVMTPTSMVIEATSMVIEVVYILFKCRPTLTIILPVVPLDDTVPPMVSQCWSYFSIHILLKMQIMKSLALQRSCLCNLKINDKLGNP